MSEMMRTVTLHGELGELFGEHWTFTRSSTKSVAEVVRAIAANRPDLIPHLSKAHQRGVAYQVIVGKNTQTEVEVRAHVPCGQYDIEIIPTPIGADGKISLILGVILIILGIALGPAGLLFDGIGLGLLSGSVATVVILAGVSLTISGIVSLITAPSDRELDRSAGFGFSGGDGLMREGDPIPIMFGEGLVEGRLMSIGIESDGWKSKDEIARVIDVIGEGLNEGIIGSRIPGSGLPSAPPNFLTQNPLFGAPPGSGGTSTGLTAAQRGIGSVYLDDLPANGRVVYEERYGEKDQDPFVKFGRTESITQVGVELAGLSANPITKATQTLRCSEIIVNLAVGSLSHQDSDGPSDQFLNVDVTIGGQTQHLALKDRFQGRRNFSLRFLINGTTPPDITVNKTTIDSSDEDTSQVFWSSFVEVGELAFRDPHLHKVGIEFRASDYRNIPKRQYLVRGMRVRVPSNYDPAARTYSGAWDGTFNPSRVYTNNPVWCFLELLTHDRFGLGQWLTDANIDLWSLYRAAQFCDSQVATGDTGRRFDWDIYELQRYIELTTGQPVDEDAFRPFAPATEHLAELNVHIQTREEALDLLRDLASAFLAMPIWTGSQLGVVQDRDEEPVYEFNRDNVESGEFVYTRTPLRAQTNRVIVSYSDPDNLFKQTKIVIEDRNSVNRTGPRQREVAAIGATRASQAARYGRWIILTEQLSGQTCTFRTGLEAGGIPVMPGAVVLIHDPTRGASKWFGRSEMPTGNLDELALDREVEIEAGTYELDIILPDVIDEGSAQLDVGQIVLSGSVPNGDYRMARVYVDADGDGVPETRRQPNSWDEPTKTLGIADSGLGPSVRAYRIEYPRALHNTTITNAPGTHTLLTMADTLSDPLPIESIWILTKPNDTKALWRVLAIAEIENQRFEIVCILYDPTKLSQVTDGITISDPIVTLPPGVGGGGVPPQPLNLKVSVGRRTRPDGTLVQDLIVTWDEPDITNAGIIGYDFAYEALGSGVIDVGLIADNRFTLVDADFGTYRFRVQTHRSDGKRSLPVVTIFDYGPNDVPIFDVSATGLEIDGQGNNTEFTGRDVPLRWRYNSPQFAPGFGSQNNAAVIDGATDPLLLDYKVEVRDAGTLALLRTDFVPKGQNNYTYTIQMNEADGGPRRDLEFTVTPRDILNPPRLGTPARLVVTNPAPRTIDSSETAFEKSGNFQLLRVKDEYPLALDHDGFLFWSSLTPGFDPLVEVPIQIQGSEAIVQTAGGETRYWRVAAIDRFARDPATGVVNVGDLNISVELSETSDAGLIDTGDIKVGAVTAIEESTITTPVLGFLGTHDSGSLTAWELVDEVNVASRGGLIEVAMLFGVHVASTGPLLTDLGGAAPNIYAQRTPKVRYRISRRIQGTPIGDPSEVEIIVSPQFNITIAGYFIGGAVSTSDAPPIGNFAYAVEMIWLADAYDQGQAFDSGAVLPGGEVSMLGVGARFFSNTYSDGSLQAGDWRFRWSTGPGTWSAWYDVVSPYFTQGSPGVGNDRVIIDSAAAGLAPVVPTDYQLEPVKSSLKSSLDMDIQRSDLLVLEWAR